MSEQAFRAAHMMQSAADDARRAANSIDESVNRLRPLFEHGYGGIAFRLVELLEADNLRIMESQDAKITESCNPVIMPSIDLIDICSDLLCAISDIDSSKNVSNMFRLKRAETKINEVIEKLKGKAK